MVQISEIKIVPVKSNNGLLAFASLVVEDAFFLSSIGIFAKPSGGYYLTFPIRKNTRQNLNFFYPINKKVADYVETEIIKKFEEINSN